MSKVIFVTYASGSYKRNIFWNKLFVKLFVKADTVMFLTDDELRKEPIYHQFLSVFTAKTGAGFWAWKPWAISKAMKTAADGDIIIYQDCGEGLRYKNFIRPSNLIKYARLHDVMPGVLVPEHGRNQDWTHQQCFKLMGCYEERFFNSPQVEASISVWKVNDKTKKIVSDWLLFCTNDKIISDVHIEQSSNFATKGHRYDQSVLTNIVVRDALIPVKHNLNELHIFKSMSFLNLYLGRKYSCDYYIWLLLYIGVKILRGLRNKFIKN
jgi:hypothetical protein